ncbi:sugar transferase [Methylocapsa polymorpha]|uniref:Sugar transferase n=1 Tax=Methylocapsa polymorpha TaxID=3080828 RepID=A0ABZ0HRM0_9HYPH|nr:sugar transferase [Methylocapsa sp. RX1]
MIHFGSIQDDNVMADFISIDSQPADGRQITQYAIGGQVKRIFDYIVSLLTIVITSPLFALVALALKLTEPGPIIFRQVRVGFGGRPFICFKFRTMCVDSEYVLAALLDADPNARAEWEASRKLVNDPRITPLGRFLRQSSLDELPQLVNILRGEMSLVGPRPIVPAEMSRYGDRLELYLSARPGLTGAWQVSGRSDCGYDKRVELDANYVSNWRFPIDLSILLRTVSAVIERKGSY